MCFRATYLDIKLFKQTNNNNTKKQQQTKQTKINKRKLKTVN
jgi:hypothetical protein